MKRFGLIGISMLLLLAGCAAEPVLDKRAAYRTAAEQGDANAQYAMGKSYCCGVGAGYYTVKALDWFCKAALQGHGGAQYQLGRYYGKRADTHWPPELRQDLVLAYMWYNLAALQNVPLAAAERDALATDLSTMELEEAQRHAREWRKIGCS